MTTVYRSPADKPGPDIVSDVLTTEESRIERGRQEINYEYPDRVLETMKIIDISFVAPGSVAQVKSRGDSRNGRLNTFSLHIQEANISGSVTVEVPK